MILSFKLKQKQENYLTKNNKNHYKGIIYCIKGCFRSLAQAVEHLIIRCPVLSRRDDRRGPIV